MSPQSVAGNVVDASVGASELAGSREPFKGLRLSLTKLHSELQALAASYAVTAEKIDRICEAMEREREAEKPLFLLALKDGPEALEEFIAKLGEREACWVRQRLITWQRAQEGGSSDPPGSPSLDRIRQERECP